ncbi:hypothetical protein BLOT_010329 [Blomia tropicalis]|nr:hypothetical protein BLOT_010329 [Blomia tropicalis]
MVKPYHDRVDSNESNDIQQAQQQQQPIDESMDQEQIIADFGVEHQQQPKRTQNVVQPMSLEKPDINEAEYGHKAPINIPVPAYTNYTSFVRLCMYILFAFYIIFAFLILSASNVDLRNPEQLLSKITNLDAEELTIERIFSLNSLFLTISAIIGIFSFHYHKYKLFVSFSAGLLFTMCYAIFSLKYSYNAYNHMSNVLDNNVTVSDIFQKEMIDYNWINYKNDSSLFINQFQFEYNCCGNKNGYRDWVPLKPDSVPNGAFPISCCRVHFDDQMNVPWCSYNDVETKPSCPEAFLSHLIHVQNRFKIQVMLLCEIVVTNIFTVVVFFFLICRGQRL